MHEPIASTRREFLKKGLIMAGMGASVPAFLNTMARKTSAAGGDAGNILVVVQLAGGNDGLNTVVPIKDNSYYKARPKLAIKPDETLKIRDDLGFHPACAGLKGLFDDGNLAIIQNVGYPNGNRSHFTGTDIYDTASPDGKKHRGWIGRYFDSEFKGKMIRAESAIAITREAPMMLMGMRYVPISFEEPGELDWKVDRYKYLKDAFKKISISPDIALGTPRQRPTTQGELEFLEKVSLDAQVTSDKIKQVTGAKGAAYPPCRLGRSLQYVSKMIAGDMATRIFHVQHGGFDTHAGQPARHQQLLKELSDSLKAFVDDMKQQKMLDRVLVMTFSEFGRRVEENGSAGTDHGAAAPMFVMGGKIKAGVHGANPDLVRLDRGDVPFKTDFRGVYADVVQNWLHGNAAEIIGPEHKPIGVIA